MRGRAVVKATNFLLPLPYFNHSASQREFGQFEIVRLFDALNAWGYSEIPSPSNNYFFSMNFLHSALATGYTEASNILLSLSLLYAPDQQLTYITKKQTCFEDSSDGIAIRIKFFLAQLLFGGFAANGTVPNVNIAVANK
jgi:hypothetical protein